MELVSIHRQTLGDYACRQAPGKMHGIFLRCIIIIKGVKKLHPGKKRWLKDEK